MAEAVSIISPDHFRFDTPPERHPVCPVCGGSLSRPCRCDYFFADPDDKEFDND